jgi:hypothetical protein
MNSEAVTIMSASGTFRQKTRWQRRSAVGGKMEPSKAASDA